MSSGAPLLSVRGVNFQVGSVAILKRLDLEVEQGEFISILGPSGCGKTTFLRLVGGLLTGYGGEIRVAGSPPLAGMLPAAYVFQAHRLLPWRTVLGNVELGLELRFRRPVSLRRHQALACLKLVGLEGMERRYPSTLSGGEKQRVALARALAVEPQLLLCDEPFANLDVNSRGLLRQELARLWRTTGKTLLLVTHDPAEAAQLSTRIVVLSDKPAEIRAVFTASAGRTEDVSLQLEQEVTRLLANPGGPR